MGDLRGQGSFFWPLRWLDHIHNHLHSIGAKLMSLQDDLNAIAAEIGTATAAIVAEIDSLESQIANGATPDLSALRSAVDSLESVVPSAQTQQ